MEAIFTLPYSEYEVINQLQTKFKKKDGFSFCIPTSRQQKGIDFVIYNNKTKKVLSVQVKSSRSYEKQDVLKYKHNFWFNNFNYEPNVADYFILFCLYPVYTSDKNIKSKLAFWKSVMLCFSDKEMGKFLGNVKTKKEQKRDSHFGISFNETDKVFGERGFEKGSEFSEYLLENKLQEIKKKLV